MTKTYKSEKIPGEVKEPSKSKVDLSIVYQEGGCQLRHYSTNRLAIYSFCIPLSFGIGAIAISSNNASLQYYLLVTELIIFYSSTYSAVIFSSLVSSIRSRLIDIEQGKSFLLHTHIRNYFSKIKYDLDTFDKLVLFLGTLFNFIFVYYICFH